MPQTELLGVVGDMFDPFEPVLRAPENHSDHYLALGRHFGDVCDNFEGNVGREASNSEGFS